MKFKQILRSTATQRPLKILVMGVLLILCTLESLRAQFYYTGRGSASLKWYQLQGDNHKLLYPDYFAPTALKLNSFLDTASPYIRHLLPAKDIRVPIILRTESQFSNGYVVWAPKRDEIVTASPQSTYAMPWLKQVTIHEGRHVAQISSMKAGLVKVATYVLGEAGLSLGLILLSKWELEGDAVLAETQLSEFGRGLQPDFTVEYRALAAAGKLNFKRIDRWVVGSYRTHYPDIYKYGYQIQSAVETYYGPDVWGKQLRYTARNPYFIVPDVVYLKKHFNTTYTKTARRAFAELDSLWQPLNAEPDSYRTLTASKGGYTTYNFPQFAPNGRILATKESYDRPQRFVEIDTTTGIEHKGRQVSMISSRPIFKDSTLYWTEFKRHPIWEQKSYSLIRRLNPGARRPQTLNRWGVNYFVTPLENQCFATVSSDGQSNSYIRLTDSDFSPLARFNFQEMTTLHGLAWDSLTQKLYFIAVDDLGMWIGAIGVKNNQFVDLEKITQPSMVSISNLRAAQGKLYFGSIASGKDEIHSLDLTTGKEFQLTRSGIGAYSPSVDEKGQLLMTTYSAEGYNIATDSDTTFRRETKWSRLPQNRVNPVRHRWDVPKFDTMVMVADSNSSINGKGRRYRQFGRQLNLHSWAPLAFDGDMLLYERDLQLALGVTAFFQSTLGDTRGYATYGWLNQQNWLKAGFIYTGLPVQIDIGAEYGGGRQLVYSHAAELNQALSTKPYWSINGALSLPLNLSGGANSRLLNPAFSITHYNAVFYDDNLNYDGTGYQRWEASLWYSNSRRSSYRSLTPRLGYAVKALVSSAFSNRFGTIYALYGRGYLPGFMANHSITVASTVQSQKRAEYQLTGKMLVPRGEVDRYAAARYAAAQVNYSLPLFYPDGGIDGFLNFKRISANVFGDYSVGNYFTTRSTTRLDHYSYGVDLMVDFNFLRSSDQSVRFTFAMPSTGKLWFGLNYSLSF